MLAQARLVLGTTRAAVTRQDSVRQRFATAAFWAVMGSLWARGLTLVMFVILGRLLGPSRFGQLAIMQSTVGTVGVFAGAGLALTVTKHVAQYRVQDARRSGLYISLTMRIACVTGVLASVLLFLLAPWLAGAVLHASHLEPGLRVASALVVFGAINGVQVGAVAGLEKFRTMAVMMGLRAVVGLSLTVTGALNAGLTGAVIGMTAAEGISALVNQLALRSACRRAGITVPYRAADRRELPALLRFAVPALLASLALNPGIWFSNLVLVNQPHGYAAMGLFIAADKWRLTLSFIPVSVTSVMLPLLANLEARKDGLNYRRLLRTNLIAQLAVLFIPGIVIVAFASTAMSVFGPTYRSGWPVLVILCMSTVPFALNDVYGQVLQSKGLQWWRFILDAVISVLLVALAVILVPRYRAEGLAVAYLLAGAAIITPLLVLARRSMPKISSVEVIAVS